MLLLLEREIWPEWLWQCEQQAITVVLANARLKQSNVQQWPNNTQWMRRRLRSITKILPADESSYKSFLSMDMAQDLLALTGNLKFDQTLTPEQSSTLSDALHGREVIVAASTHEADEEAILTHWPNWATANPKALLVVAPRHPQRFAYVAQRLQNLLGTESPNTLAIWSLRDSITPNTRVLLLDTIGELTQVYPLAKVCLMGGTWSKVGGHNALEPLSAECPVLFGPHTQQFPDLYADMEQSGSAIRIESTEIWLKITELLNNLDMLKLMQGAGLAFVKAHQGSADRTMAHLQQLKCWPVQPMTPVKTTGCKNDCVWFNSSSIFYLENKELEGSNYVGSSEALATGSGRGQALKVKIDGIVGVLRHYKRGGLIAKFRADTYPGASTNMSRAMQEFSLLREMRSVGLSVPEPLAARYVRVRTWLGRFSTYRADILVEWLANTQNLAQKLDHGRLSVATWLSIGQAIAQLHAYGIDHTDLNCHNILIGDDDHVWLVDFDKCSRRSDGKWKDANLRRLLRSLRKEHLRRPGFCWVEQDWVYLIEGYSNQTKNKRPKTY
jgi:3-deoxy-D-manno-octulosonic-acid transferase